MKNNLLKSALLVASGIVIGSSITVFASSYVQVLQNTEISISVDGENKILKDETTGVREYPLTYNDRTYIPLRSVATLLGFDVDYNTETKTAIINSKEYTAKNPSIDARDYAGDWGEIIPEDASGSGTLTIEAIDNNTINFKFYEVSAPPASRIAGIEITNVELDDRGMGFFDYEDDGWGNKGKGTITLSNNEVAVNIYGVQRDEDAMWGFFEGIKEFKREVNERN